MPPGDAAHDEDPTEELRPEDVATAAQSTQRRAKQSDSPPQIEIQMADFDDPIMPLSMHEIEELGQAPFSQPTPSAPASDPYLGKIIAERYLVERLLGVGSMGLVYRCRHTVLDKTVALKIIRQDLAQDDETVGRFVTEARSASAIGSKHIVEVLDFGMMPDGASYIVMEYLEGLTLGEALDTPGGLSLGDALDIGIQMTEALGAAHAAGVVHRDLKPDNVFLLQSPDGWFVKILDFGIAKIMQSGQKLTVAGSVIGTPHYMSPEQATGGRTDARTDVYSLGCILYEMACGRVPFDAENPLAVISMQVTDDPPPLRKRMPAGRTLPLGFDAVVQKCLAKDTTERFASMDDVRAALERIAGGGVPLVAPPSNQEAGSYSYTDELDRDTDFRELHAGGRRRRWVARGALLALLGAASAGAFLFVRPYLSIPTPPPVHVGASLGEAVAKAGEPIAAASAALATESTAAPAANATPLTHVALILFPLNSHAFDGDKDLGMMPITIDLEPGQSKIVTITRKGYVSRPLKLDGSKTRIVVGLVSDAAAAKRHGKSFDEAVAEADRAAASAASDDSTAPATLTTGDKPTRTAKTKGAAKSEPSVTKDETPVAPPPAAPKPHSGSGGTLAPNPFGD